MSAAPAPKSTPYEVFLHLMMMSMAVVTVIALISLILQYIDLSFPDELLSYGSAFDSIRYGSSALIVAFPAFLLSAWLIAKDLKLHKEKSQMLIRKWLIYLALFVTSITVVIDLIQLVDRFYSGELTLPFFLKVLTVLLVSLLVFAYFRWDLNRERGKTQLPALFAVISSIGMLIVLACGFIFAGSPQHQRQVRFDETRVADLQNIAYEISEYWRQKDALPLELSDLERDLYYFGLPLDPSTKESYEYNVLGELSFELCADFDLETQTLPDETPESDKWFHSAGHNCFANSIDPDFYTQDEPKLLR